MSTTFFGKKTPWQTSGTALTTNNMGEAMQLAGLNWEVKEKNSYCLDVDSLDEVPEEHRAYLASILHDCPAKAFVRSDNKKVLGVVGPNTHALQNSIAFNFFQPFLDSGEATLDTAGCLQDGARLWVLCRLNSAPIVVGNGDEVNKNILLSNSHDGTLAVRVGFTPIRVACANTLAMAHRSTKSQLIRLRHSKNVVENVTNVVEVMNLANQSFDATAEQYKMLANKNINAKDLERYVRTVLKVSLDPQEELAKKTVNTISEILDIHERNTLMHAELALAREKVTEAFELENITSTRGTWWTAYNAFNSWLNHTKGHSEQTRLNSLWFGPSASANEDALTVAVQMAG